MTYLANCVKNYSYSIDAVVEIKNKLSGKVMFAPVYSEVPKNALSSSGAGVAIRQKVRVDYEKYNKIAEEFISTYDLTGVDANLVLKMNVNVIGTSDEFLNDTNSNSYVSSVRIPLSTQTVEVKVTSTIPAEEQKILSYTTKETSDVFTAIAIVLAFISAILAIILVAFTYL